MMISPLLVDERSASSCPCVEERAAIVHQKRLCGQSITNNSRRGQPSLTYALKFGAKTPLPGRAEQ
jgi:hypothetical protein